jgi:PPP family 3-phenylpropionic acid transporter
LRGPSSLPGFAPLALLYGTLFFELGVNLPFLPVWLRAQALSDAEIGLVLAAPLVARLLANPLATALADRAGQASGLILGCAVAVLAGLAMLAGVHGLPAILLVVFAIGLAQGPLIALSDSFTLDRLSAAPAPELAYGRIRLWGSLAFMVASLGGGLVLDHLTSSAILVMLIASSAAVATAAWVVRERALPPEPAHAASRPKSVPATATGSVGLVLLTVGGAALVQASHAVLYAFSSLHWERSGLSGLSIGALWATGVLAEIALFAGAGLRLSRVPGGVALVLAGGVAATLRWLGMAADPTVAALVALQALHGLSFGATHLGSIFLLHRLAPPGFQAQAQGWLAALWAASMAVLTSLAGWLYPSWGQQTYLGMAAVSGAGLLMLGIVALRTLGPRRL